MFGAANAARKIALFTFFRQISAAGRYSSNAVSRSCKAFRLPGTIWLRPRRAPTADAGSAGLCPQPRLSAMFRREAVSCLALLPLSEISRVE